jgi:hypothetical protein
MDKNYSLYKPGDIFVVNESGWLVKVDKYEHTVRAE